MTKHRKEIEERAKNAAIPSDLGRRVRMLFRANRALSWESFKRGLVQVYRRVPSLSWSSGDDPHCWEALMTQRSSPDLENQYPQVSESGAPRDDRRRPILARRTDETGSDRES